MDGAEMAANKDETRHSSKGFAGRVLRKRSMLDSRVTLKDYGLFSASQRKQID